MLTRARDMFAVADLVQNQLLAGAPRYNAPTVNSLSIARTVLKRCSH